MAETKELCYECNICGLCFKHHSSLSRHKSKCKAENEVKNSIEKEINNLKEQLEKQKVMYEEQLEKQKLMFDEQLKNLKLMFEEQKLMYKEQITQQQTTISSLIEANKQQPSNEVYNPYNPPSTNNIIQLPVKQPFSFEKYLCNECKDAINIKTFRDNFVVTEADFMKLKYNKVEDVVEEVLKRETEKYTSTTRPFQVSNLRDKNVWVKNEKNEWENNDVLLKKFIENQIYIRFMKLKNKQLEIKCDPSRFINGKPIPRREGDESNTAYETICIKINYDESMANKIFTRFLKNIVVEKK